MAHKIHWGRKGIGPDLGGKGTQPHKKKNRLPRPPMIPPIYKMILCPAPKIRV
jgi:hypothetical protein